MKHLSLWVTVSLLLGTMPLTAAAADYGPDRALLAAENAAPQLPDAQMRAAPALTKPDIIESSADGTADATPASPRMAPSTSSPQAQAPRSRGPSASNKQHAPVPPKTDPEPGPASWRSLLPGSIQ